MSPSPSAPQRKPSTPNTIQCLGERPAAAPTLARKKDSTMSHSTWLSEAWNASSNVIAWVASGAVPGGGARVGGGGRWVHQCVGVCTEREPQVQLVIRASLRQGSARATSSPLQYAGRCGAGAARGRAHPGARRHGLQDEPRHGGHEEAQQRPGLAVCAGGRGHVWVESWANVGQAFLRCRGLRRRSRGAATGCAKPGAVDRRPPPSSRFRGDTAEALPGFHVAGPTACCCGPRPRRAHQPPPLGLRAPPLLPSAACTLTVVAATRLRTRFSTASRQWQGAPQSPPAGRAPRAQAPGT